MMEERAALPVESKETLLTPAVSLLQRLCKFLSV